MTYLLITDDGAVTWGEKAPTLDLVDDLVGKYGHANVWLDQAWRVHGWGSDCGLVMEGYSRNVLGSCVLACLGARQQPYGGPVLVTGYDWGSDWGGPEPLDDDQVRRLRTLLDEVGRALGGAVGGGMPAVWYAEIRRYAAEVRDGEIPPITFETL